uniref:Uncharacterized protein n=1 Tax=Arundo donax TaxID=35708 RepID=A0A0A9CLD6_ARUDO
MEKVLRKAESSSYNVMTN